MTQYTQIFSTTSTGTRIPAIGIASAGTESKTLQKIEEEEWKMLVAQPEIQQGFSRLAEKIRADIVAGKSEEGGFAVE